MGEEYDVDWDEIDDDEDDEEDDDDCDDKDDEDYGACDYCHEEVPTEELDDFNCCDECRSIRKPCYKCERPTKLKCKGCGKSVCSKHRCSWGYCSPCQEERGLCAVCGDVITTRKCPRCDRYVCSNCFETCDNCDKELCSRCMGNDGFCSDYCYNQRYD